MSHWNLIPDFIHTKYKDNQFTGDFAAAALFIDIAGFTPLTETLAQYHRDGAETLTNILNHTFGPHVSEVYRRGGIIPLFAGDAFVAIFPANDADQTVDNSLRNASEQAVQTAVAIQTYFRDAGIVKTTYGDFEIGVKIGLATGNIQWGIPGKSPNYGFYFRGSAIDNCTSAQEQANVGEILAHHNIVSILAGLIDIEEQGSAEYVKVFDCKNKTLPPKRELPGFDSDALIPFIPEAILDMTTDAEFREVAPVFISFDAPQDITQFHAFTDEVIQLAKQYGGYFSQIEFGDKGGIFVILFGAPIAYENQVERAAEFLQTMQRHNFEIRWRAGVTFGVVWAGIRGAPERCEYGTVGDMVNLAARLAMKADWGKIWVNETVNARLTQKYWLGALGEFPVKGKQKHVQIYQLFHKKEASQDAYYNGEFIGRNFELEQLIKWTEPIFNGRFGGIVYVHGETGTGKSRLVHEYRRKLMGTYYPSTFYCPTEEIMRSSLNPFKNFLRAYFRQSAERGKEENQYNFDTVYDYFLQQIPSNHPEAPEIKQELIRTRSILAALVDIHWEESLYENLEPKLRFENSLSAFKNFVKAASLSRPVILHIENGQWLDPDSRRMLTSLTRNIDNYPIIIICVNRYLDDGKKVEFEVDTTVEQQHLEIGALDLHSIHQMVAQILEGEITKTAVSFLANKSEGNPFYLEQLILDLYERELFFKNRGGIYDLRSVTDQDVPTNINTLLLSRLDRLENEVKHVVRTATVLGHEFEYRVLAHMLEDDPQLINKVQIAEEKQVWIEQHSMHYLFQSTLLRDAAYSMQLRVRLRELHKRAAEGIQALFSDDLSPYISDLAYHYDAASMPQEAITWYEQAGKNAANAYANDEAINHLSRALTLTHKDDMLVRYKLLLQREEIYALVGNHEKQLADLDQLQALAETLQDKHKIIEISLRQALYSEAIGEYETAVSRARSTTFIAHERGNKEREVKSRLCWGRALLRQGKYEEAQKQFQLVMSQAPGSLQNIIADSIRNLGVINVDLGNFDKAQNYYQSALNMYQQLNNQTGTTVTLNNLGVLTWEQKNYQEARKYYQEALTLYRQMGYRRGEGMVLGNLGILLMSYGDYANALSYNQSALFIAQEIGIKLGQFFACVNLGLTYLFRDAIKEAQHYSELALKIAKEMGGIRFQGYAWTTLGHVLLSQNKFDEADKSFRKALQVWHDMEQANLAIEARAGIAEVALQANNMTEAKAQVDVIMRYLEEGNTLTGTESPFQIYLTTYEVLTAVSDHRANRILVTVYKKLQENASKIKDKETRHAFLNNIWVHKKIVKLYQDSFSNPQSLPQTGFLY
jgi:class 3 adenylate cyclase/predicted ATPase